MISRRSMTALLLGVAAVGCSRDRHVPFGLEQEQDSPLQTEALVPVEPLVGEVYPPGEQVTLTAAEATMALPEGHALASLQVDLNTDTQPDVFYLQASENRTELAVGIASGSRLDRRFVAEFQVPLDCQDARGTLQSLGKKMALATAEHTCPEGQRLTYWIATVEAQPRVRERITLLPPTESNPAAMSLSIAAEDRDQDGHDDVVATFVVNGAEVPIVWLDRPGGFARDASEPESTLRELAQSAAAGGTAKAVIKNARATLAVFEALCREGGESRIGLSGTHGIQCQRSEGAGAAAALLVRTLVRQGRLVEARRAMDWLTHPNVTVPPKDQERVTQAWRKARTPRSITWQSVDTETGEATLSFENSSTLLIRAGRARTIDLSSRTRTNLRRDEGPPPIHDPTNSFAARRVYRTCKGYEAEVRSLIGQARRRNRVLIASEPQPPPCDPLRDRIAGPDEWQVLGWAPQGLLAVRGTRLRIVPLDTRARLAGQPVDLQPDALPPAPLSGAAITPTGSHYIIATQHGLLLRKLGASAKGVWIRPADWDAVAGSVRSVALSPDATAVAVHKGTDIRVIRW